MYYKQRIGTVQKAAELTSWVQWSHHSEGKTHCEECLKLDGCWFQKEKAPPCPHHPFCHCTLEPIDYAFALANASTYSDFSKFDPYLFDPENFYQHGKNRAFESWGYSVSDSRWLQNEIERQAHEKYLVGDYKLGLLDQWGQRINIRVEISRKDGIENVSFITGLTVQSRGQIKLNTPYGGK